MADFNSFADMIESCAAQAVQTAQAQFGFTLDYSDRSIQSLETILANITLDTTNNDAIEQAVKIWGSYLGEVARRSFGGAWELIQPPGRAAAVPTLVIAGSQLYPMMKIYRRLTMGEPENVLKFYEKIRDRLSTVHPTDTFAN